MKTIKSRIINILWKTYGGYIPSDVHVIIDKADFTAIEENSLDNYLEWLGQLPEREISGLNKECRNYVQCWGDWRGRLTVKELAKDAILEIPSNKPKDIAKSVFDRLCPAVYSPLDATTFVIDMVDSSLLELGETHDR